MSRPERLEKQYFFDDPIIDAMLNSVTGLAMEVSVLRERLDTVERALNENGTVSREIIDSYEPDPAVSAERMKARMTIVQAVLDPFKECFSASGRASLSNSEHT